MAAVTSHKSTQYFKICSAVTSEDACCIIRNDKFKCIIVCFSPQFESLKLKWPKKTIYDGTIANLKIKS